MKRRHAWPKGHWSWPVDITHKHGMRSGSMIWIGEQLDMTETGEVCHAGDVFAQIPPVVRHVERVLEDLEARLADLVKLLCFYVNDGSLDESTVLAAIAAALPRKPGRQLPSSRSPISPIPASPWSWRAVPCAARMAQHCPAASRQPRASRRSPTASPRRCAAAR